MKLTVQSITSAKLVPPFKVLDELIKACRKQHIQLRQKDIIVVTSKIVALAQHRIVRHGDRNTLARQEADHVLFETSRHHLMTVTQGLLMIHAGIDRSNVPGHEILLFPKNLDQWTRRFWLQLKRAFHINKLGLIITDSRNLPLRSGVSAIACSHAGFEGVQFLRGIPDIFGHPLRATRVNLADELANAALVCMGEADEQTPFALIRGARVLFTDRPKRSLKVPLQKCMYNAMFKKSKK